MHDSDDARRQLDGRRGTKYGFEDIPLGGKGTVPIPEGANVRRFQSRISTLANQYLARAERHDERFKTVLRREQNDLLLFRVTAPNPYTEKLHGKSRHKSRKTKWGWEQMDVGDAQIFAVPDDKFHGEFQSALGTSARQWGRTYGAKFKTAQCYAWPNEQGELTQTLSTKALPAVKITRVS